MTTLRRPPKLAERPIQRATVRLLSMMGYLVIHTPNGSHLAGDAFARAAAMLDQKAR